jgi:hypothetical protein
MLAARVKQKNGLHYLKSTDHDHCGRASIDPRNSRSPDQHSSHDLTAPDELAHSPPLAAPQTEHHDAQAAPQQRVQTPQQRVREH